jgi:cytidine deaminase
MDYEASHRAIYYGDIYSLSTKQTYRYGGQPATFLLDDFNKALAYLFARENKELQDSHIADVTAIEKGEARPEPITTIKETATSIWNDLLPRRKIDLTGNAVHTLVDDDKYHGKEMSDGERVMLYMICQTLLLPPKSVIIIDEPELHIHKAIVKKLWDKLETSRNDCVFMYITHDLDFAASRKTEHVIWIKNYNGSDWEYEPLNISNYSNLPQELLFELIGTRKKVLFVEGERNGYDHALYNQLFIDKGYHVIPCGGCQEVVRIYKAKKAYDKLNEIEAHCLIDRDYRTDTEITALEADGVNFLAVAEVENLFVVPALLEIMEKQLGCTAGTAKNAEGFIVSLFNSNKGNQIKESFIKEVNHQLTLLNYVDKEMTPQDICSDIADKFSEEKVKAYLVERESAFSTVSGINEILQVFNFKELSGKIGSKFGLRGNMEYPKRVINLLQSNQDGVRDRILSALKPYIPDLP